MLGLRIAVFVQDIGVREYQGSTREREEIPSVMVVDMIWYIFLYLSPEKRCDA